MPKAANVRLLPSTPLRLLTTFGLALWLGADCGILSTALAQPTLAEALDGADLVWSTGGHNVWRGQTYVTHDALDAAYSWVAPVPPYGNEPWLETTVVGPGTVSFWWKVSSDPGGDAYLEFYIGGTQQTNPISGEVDWTLMTRGVPAGFQTLRWRLVGRSSSGSTYSWVDEVAFVRSPIPVILAQPQTRTVYGGGTVQFEVGVSGGLPLAYQWQRNGTSLEDGTNATLTLTNVQFNQAGAYSVVVSNAFGTAVSSNAVLTVVPSLIVGQPKSLAVVAGRTAFFDVGCEGIPPRSLQWRWNEIEIPNATNGVLWLTNVQISQAGFYSAVVSNAYGVVTSSNALLHVVPGVELSQRGQWPGQAWDVDVVGNYAFVSLNFYVTNGLVVLDLSDPTAPRQVGYVPDFGLSLDVWGHHAFTVMGGGVTVFDVSTPAHPLFLASSLNMSEYPRDVEVVDRFAYQAAYYGLWISDVAAPSDPTWLAHSHDVTGNAISVDGTNAYMLTRAGLTIFDVSHPEVPVRVGTCPLIGAERVQAVDSWAYVAAGTNGLIIVDARDPVNPRMIASYKRPGYGRVHGMDVVWPNVYLATDPYGLEVIDVSEPTLPCRVSNALPDHYAQAVRVVGRHAFLVVPYVFYPAYGYAGLFTFEVLTASNAPPIIRVGPTHQTASIGGTATFSVNAVGDLPLFHQWRFHGTNLTGATNYALRLSEIQPQQVGSYSVVVSNVAGETISTEASLDLLVAPRILTDGTDKPAFNGASRRFTFAFLTQDYVMYAVESTEDLERGPWLRATNVAGNGEMAHVTIASGQRSRSFYRVRVR